MKTGSSLGLASEGPLSRVPRVTLRCNNREFQFDDPALFQHLLAFIGHARRVHGLRLLDCCLMTHHFHPGPLRAPVGGARFRSTLIEAERSLLEALLYVDLNPTSAGLVPEPWAWPWSGSAHRASAATRRGNDPAQTQPREHS